MVSLIFGKLISLISTKKHIKIQFHLFQNIGFTQLKKLISETRFHSFKMLKLKHV